MNTSKSNCNQTNRNKEFPQNAKFIIYKTSTKESIKNILLEEQKNWKTIKKIAPENSYWFILEDENRNKLPWFYILDGQIKNTDWIWDEDWYFDMELNQVNKKFWKCKQYVKTRILDIFLKFDPRTMKIV